MVVGGTTLSNAGFGDIFLVKYDPNGTVLWAKRLGGSGDESVEALTVDISGNITITGRFAGTVSFGGTSLVASGSQDMFIAKYAAADGAHIWSKSFGGAYDDLGAGIVTDFGENIYLTGYYRGTVDFGGGPLISPLDTDLNVFLAKFNSSGIHQWSKRFWNSGNDRGTSITVQGSTVAIGGYYTNSISFQGTATAPGIILDAGSSFTDGYIAKFNTSDGSNIWQKNIGISSSNDYVFAVAANSSGDIMATGFITQNVNFGGGATTSLGGQDAYIAQYASVDGTYQWARRIGGPQDDQGYAFAVDGANNIYLGGGFRDIADFGGTTLSSDVSVSAGYVAKYTANGTLVFVRRQGSGVAGQPSYVKGVAASPAAVGVATGNFTGSGTFEGVVLNSLGSVDGFLVRMAP